MQAQVAMKSPVMRHLAIAHFKVLVPYVFNNYMKETHDEAQEMHLVPRLFALSLCRTMKSTHEAIMKMLSEGAETQRDVQSSDRFVNLCISYVLLENFLDIVMSSEMWRAKSSKKHRKNPPAVVSAN